MYMIQNCQMEEGDMGPNPLEMLFNELQERDPLHPAVLQFNSFKLGSTKTLQSVLITLLPTCICSTLRNLPK